MITALVNISTNELQTADRNPAAVYLAGLAEGSRRTMADALSTIANILMPGADMMTFPWGELRYQHTQAVRAALAERYAAPTVNKHLSALRGVLKAAWRLGLISADDFQAAADVASVTGEKPDQAAGRAVTLGELMALSATCNDGTARGARDAAVLAVAYTCGLRRAELANLDLANYDQATGTLTVHGKRNKTRTTYVTNGAAAAMSAWLAVRGDAPGPLFCGLTKGGKVTQRRLTPQAIYKAMQERSDDAGVPHFSPHDLRRTFAGDLLDAGADIATVARLMGHANVATTAGYDRRGERAKQDAARKLHFPYQR